MMRPGANETLTNTQYATAMGNYILMPQSALSTAGTGLPTATQVRRHMMSKEFAIKLCKALHYDYAEINYINSLK